MFEFNSKNVRKILLIITYTLLLCFALINIDVVFKFLGYILNLLKPFIIGFCLAFILNIPLCKFENTVKDIKEKMKSKKKSKSVKTIEKSTKLRLCGIIFSIFIFVGIVFLTLFLVIPEFINTISIFKESIPTAYDTVQGFVKETMTNYPEITEKITSYRPNWEELDSNVKDMIQSAATGIIGVSLDLVIGIFSGIVNFFMGLIFAIYMLSQKETLVRQVKRLVSAYLPKQKCDRVFYVSSIVNETFKKFFGGQFIEAILLGVICFIGMSIFRFPYALTISVLVGVTALIPVFGAFFGTGIGAILILAIDPMKALWFIVFIIVIQQIDGNFIYPKIVGNQVGLPGIWVMLAVLVGGNSLGIIGMLISVPIASVIYRLVGEYINSKKEENTIQKQN